MESAPVLPADVRSFLIYEDRHVLAFNKPPGLAVQGGSGVTESLDVLLEQLPRRNGRIPRLAHRLDRDTTGVVVAGRTSTAIAALSAAFADRTARKAYLALVCGGAPAEAEGEISAPLAKTKINGADVMRVANAGERGGLDAVTAYCTMAAVDDVALLEVRPQSGRMHQIRAHLAHIGRPIFGDVKYGGLLRLRGLPARGLGLHAARLWIPHPAGGMLSLRAAASRAFVETAEALGVAHQILQDQTECLRVE